MINYLYANGCSWTHGNGINEDPKYIKNTSLLDYAWPAELGKLLNCKVNNDAWGGGSNTRIVRKTISFIEQYPSDKVDGLLVIIGWTTPERDEIFVPAHGNWCNYNAAQTFSDQFISKELTDTQREVNRNIDKVQKSFVTWVHSHSSDLNKYFQEIFLLKNYLENKKVKYVFFNALPWTWIPLELTESYIHKYRAFSSANFIGPDTDETMMSFCLENNFPISSCIHPMIEGHKFWAEKLHKTYLNAYNV